MGNSDFLDCRGVVDVDAVDADTLREIKFYPFVCVTVEVTQRCTARKIYACEVVALAIDGVERTQTTQIERSKRTTTSHNRLKACTTFDIERREFVVVVAVKLEEVCAVRHIQRVQTVVYDIEHGDRFATAHIQVIYLTTEGEVVQRFQSRKI